AQQTGGSSFVDSLKASVQAIDYPGDWATQAVQEAQAAQEAPGNHSGDHDYSSDPSSGGRISSPVLESSREQSVSIDVGEREGLRAAAMHQHEPAPEMPPLAGPLDSSPRDLPADSARGVPHGSHANGGSAMPVPAPSAAPGLGAKLFSSSSQSASEQIVMRPISMGMDPHNAHSPKPNSMPHNAQAAADDDDQWQESIDNYEYGGTESTAPNGMPIHAAAQSEQTRGPPMPSALPAEQQQQQLEQRRPSDHSMSHGPSAGAGVRWAPEMPTHASTSTNPFERKNSNTSSIGSTHVRANSSHIVDHGMSMYSDIPQGPSSVYSTSSVSQAPPQGPPLTSLQSIDIQIKDSRVKIDERGKEVNVYMVDVVWHKAVSGMSLQEILVESQQSEVLLWTVEKRYSDFLNLNSKLRHVIHRERLLDKLERLPEKDIFRPNAPTKTDKRKLWFERYLQKALSLTVSDKRPLL
ncbi:Rho GTPase activating protein, partial [Coemansia sp. RSA 2618]